jgi:hypothetical protein
MEAALVIFTTGCRDPKSSQLLLAVILVAENHRSAVSDVIASQQSAVYFTKFHTLAAELDLIISTAGKND